MDNLLHSICWLAFGLAGLCLVLTTKIRNITTKKLVTLALFVALFVVLSMVATISLPWIKITSNAIPILLASVLYGPWEGMIVGLLGALIEQLLSPYGVTITTALWILPAAVRGLLVGWYAKKHRFSLSLFQASLIFLTSSLIVTLLNTVAIYIDAVIFGYYEFSAVFGTALLTRVLSSIVTALIMLLLIPPLYRALQPVLCQNRGSDTVEIEDTVTRMIHKED